MLLVLTIDVVLFGLLLLVPGRYHVYWHVL